MKYVFVGAVKSSYHALDEFYRQGLNPDLVCTLQTTLSARHSDFEDIRPLALGHGTPVLGVNNINDEEVIAQLRVLQPDYIFVLGWSQLLRTELLNLPKSGCIGVHPSLLPKHRGRAVVPWTILTGLEESGVSLFYLDEGTDTGDIISQRRYRIAPDETASTLYTKATTALQEIIAEIAPLLQKDQPLPASPQDHEQASYCARRTPEDGWIDWQRSAREIWTLVRAVGKPYPGAFTVYNEHKVIIWHAAMRSDFHHIGLPGQILAREGDAVVVQCGSGWLDVLLVEDEAGNETAAADSLTHIHDKLGVNPYSLWRICKEQIR